MSKVKITQEQARRIDNICSKDYAVIRHIKGWETGKNERLNELNLDEFIRALYIGYEVEPEFKVGDWVRVSWNNDNPTIHKVTGPIKYGGLEIDGDQRNKRPGLNVIRHATPEEIAEEKERRWWKSNNRDVWGIKKGDSLLHDAEREYPDIIFEVGDFNIHFTDGHFYPKEYIKENYKVFCFAEDRKDV